MVVVENIEYGRLERSGEKDTCPVPVTDLKAQVNGVHILGICGKKVDKPSRLMVYGAAHQVRMYLKRTSWRAIRL